jgi:hypothetical protein
MRLGFFAFIAVVFPCPSLPVGAQDLGPGFTKIKEGIYVFAPDATTTTCSFVVTQEGVVMRPTVAIPDVLASYKLMKSLSPEIVVTGHGPPTTTKVFDEYEGFYNLLLKRVGDMAAQGKSLDEIKKELKMPEYADWHDQDRLGVNIEAADRTIKKSPFKSLAGGFPGETQALDKNKEAKLAQEP